MLAIAPVTDAPRRRLAPPTGKSTIGLLWQRVSWELAGSQEGKPYGQGAQAETGISMLQRNLSDALRSRSAAARRCEMLFCALVHNLML
jgi:hypothetical protein